MSSYDSSETFNFGRARCSAVRQLAVGAGRLIGRLKMPITGTFPATGCAAVAVGSDVADLGRDRHRR